MCKSKNSHLLEQLKEPDINQFGHYYEGGNAPIDVFFGVTDEGTDP